MKGSRIIGKEKGKGVWWSLLLVTLWGMGMKGVSGVYTYSSGTIFNGKEHDALCSVFQSGLDLWNASRNSDLKLASGLESALGQALFGNIVRKDLSGITQGPPVAYKSDKPKHRGIWCGTCNNKYYYPGSSITHDLLCLCTAGQYGRPYYGHFWLFGWHPKETSFKLCGKERANMVENENSGWHAKTYYKNQQAKDLDKTWRTVVWGCYNSWKSKAVQRSHNLEERLRALTGAMENFTNKLTIDRNKWHKLGGFQEHTESDGSDERHIHVRYGPCNNARKPWWRRLQEALRGKTPSQLLLEPSVASSQATRSEHEADGKGEEKNFLKMGGEGHMEPGENTGLRGPQPPRCHDPKIHGSPQIPNHRTPRRGRPQGTPPTFQYLRKGRGSTLPPP
ncbi:Variant surface glycoprotein [Trypanosoma congolense IL3000]|uniref:Variant surface glycoprotein n=1 Tax=Trypanosoma congolense (strain IL3000) TaxID=1068625 RepID=F9WE62_TRYCI|nr:Variant surface glycoprotein [Trypanosoma congolense IL3000]